jgi:uncharacterized protein (TIGR02217 family)
MGFHEVRFPTSISFNSSGGPGYNTNIIETDSGSDVRIARWSNAKRKYNVACGIRTQADLSLLLDFYLARQGPTYGFRYKDFLDFSSAANHYGTPANTDQQIGLGDAATTQFQLVKKYTSGSTTKTRTITKPVSATTIIAFDGAAQSSGWSVDTTTGIVTFTSAPGEDVVITAGFQFDVPVHFENDEDLQRMSIDSFNAGSVSSIMLIELKAETSVISDGFNYGGAVYDALDTSLSLSVLQGRVYNLAPAVAGKVATLPATTSLSCGGPYFFVHNSGSESFNINSYAGTLVTVVAAGATYEIILAKDSGGNKVWYAL